MAEGEYTKEQIGLSKEQEKSRKARNYAIALALAAFVVLLWLLTWAKLGINLFVREI